jgi:hypothetical protein
VALEPPDVRERALRRRLRRHRRPLLRVCGNDRARFRHRSRRGSLAHPPRAEGRGVRGDLRSRRPAHRDRRRRDPPHRPIAYQALPGGRREIEAAYSQDARGAIGFRLGDYDRAEPLVIDPIITYSSFLGGSGNSDSATSVAYDHAGFAYIIGTTSAFPVTAGAYKTSTLGPDAFVAKLDPNQTGAASLVWATYLGGEAGEATGDIAVDAASNVYVVLTAQDGFRPPRAPTTPPSTGRRTWRS